MSLNTVKSVSPPPRYRSGGYKQTKKSEKVYTERRPGSNTLWRRLKDYQEDLRKLGADPNLSTVLGRLYLFGVLSEVEFGAGILYADLAGRYARYHKEARESAASPNYQRGLGREDEVERHNKEGTMAAYERRARAARKSWEKATSVIPNERAREVLRSVCVLDQEVSQLIYDDLKILLRKIADKFGIQENSDRPPRR
jgi:hypothetical protein